VKETDFHDDGKVDQEADSRLGIAYQNEPSVTFKEESTDGRTRVKVGLVILALLTTLMSHLCETLIRLINV